MRTASVRSPHALINPVKSLQAIAAKTRILRTPQVAPKFRPALAIVPNNVIPLAVSLWQRQPAQPQTPAIAVRQANRFETRTASLADFEPCDRSTLQKQPAKRNVFQVCLRERVVAEFPSRSQAESMASRLRQWFAANENSEFVEAGESGAGAIDSEWRDRLRLQMLNGLPAAVADETVLFTVDSRTARAIRRNRELIAIEWMNQLRLALNAEPLSFVQAQMQLYGLSDRPRGELSGTASWYGPYFHGRLTAAGEIFNQNELTAAHPNLPFNTFLKVTNLETGKSVIVRINDRGPYVKPRSLDLSWEAARQIGSDTSGVVNYEAVILEPQAVAQERPSPDAIALNRTR